MRDDFYVVARAEILAVGSARVSRAVEGVTPSTFIQFHFTFLETEKLCNEVCGVTPKTARQRRALLFNSTTNLPGFARSIGIASLFYPEWFSKDSLVQS